MKYLDQDRFRGALLGLATGDALGTTLEFKRPGSFAPIHDMVGGGPFGLEPGQWTDDTSMALCLAESLLARDGMDLTDQAQRYVRWWREGENSCTGRCFDIGNTVSGALHRFIINGIAKAGSSDAFSAGNGSLMRLAPIPMFFAVDAHRAVDAAGESSLTTHGATEAVDCCQAYAALLVGALQGLSREELLAPDFIRDFTGLGLDAFSPKVRAILLGRYKIREASTVRGSGYVVESMNAALWAFFNSSNFQDGALCAVNLGDDADTTGAIYGQLAGAYYGARSIPSSWLSKLAWKSKISTLADRIRENALSQQSQESS